MSKIEQIRFCHRSAVVGALNARTLEEYYSFKAEMEMAEETERLFFKNQELLIEKGFLLLQMAELENSIEQLASVVG